MKKTDDKTKKVFKSENLFDMRYCYICGFDTNVELIQKDSDNGLHIEEFRCTNCNNIIYVHGGPDEDMFPYPDYFYYEWIKKVLNNGKGIC